MQIFNEFLTPNKYSRPQTSLRKVNGIAIHWVGNAGSSAKVNRNYFESLKHGKNKIYASSHYIIGLNGEIIRCIPEDEISYCTNARNFDTISIELCHPDWIGKFNLATYNSLVWLSANLCEYYNLNPLSSIIRHYDVTKKVCPKWFVDNLNEFAKLKEDVKIEIENRKEVIEEDTGDDENMIEQPTHENENLEKHWAYKQIKYCMDKDILVGYPDGTFRPENSVSRAELAVVLAKANEFNKDEKVMM